MHYSKQTTLAALEGACLETFDGVQWVKLWFPQGGNRYVGRYANGQAVIYGPMNVGNPNKPWFEIQVSDPAVLADLGIDEASTMKAQMRTSALMQASYRASGRGKIRNSRGKPVGVVPEFVISGTNPEGSFLGDDDPEQAPEIPGLD